MWNGTDFKLDFVDKLMDLDWVENARFLRQGSLVFLHIHHFASFECSFIIAKIISSLRSKIEEKIKVFMQFSYFRLDFNDGMLPFHRRTNGRQPSKTIKTNGCLTPKPSKNH